MYPAPPITKPRSEFVIIDAMKDLFRMQITNLKIEVSPGSIVVEVLHQGCGYTLTYSELGVKASVTIEVKKGKTDAEKDRTDAVQERTETVQERELVEQNYILIVLEHLRSLFNDLAVDTVISQLDVIVANDALEAEKYMFFTELQHHFESMGKMLNVALFNMKYSGKANDERELITFLRNINLIAYRQLKFQTSNPLSSELFLNEVFSLDQWQQIGWLSVERPMWTNIPFDRWLRFGVSEICLLSLDVERIEEIIEHCHSNCAFLHSTITILNENWRNVVGPWIDDHFNNAYLGRYLNSLKGFQVTMADTCKFIVTDHLNNDPLNDSNPNGLNLLSIDLSPERARLKVHDSALKVNMTFIPVVPGLVCRFIREVRPFNDVISYEHQPMSDDYMHQLVGYFRKVLAILNENPIIDEFHVAVGWKEEDASKIHKDVFVALIALALHEKKTYLRVKKFVVEYSGAGEDENIVTAFLPWIQLIETKELNFRVHPLLDDRKRELVLTESEQVAGGRIGVLSLPAWANAHRFKMHENFFWRVLITKWMHFPWSEIYLESISLVQLEILTSLSLLSPTFIACTVRTIEPNWDEEVRTLMNQHNNRMMDEERTTFVIGKETKINPNGLSINLEDYEDN